MLVRNDERCVISFFVLLLCWCSLAWSQNLTWSVDLVPCPPFPLLLLLLLLLLFLFFSVSFSVSSQDNLIDLLKEMHIRMNCFPIKNVWHARRRVSCWHHYRIRICVDNVPIETWRMTLKRSRVNVNQVPFLKLSACLFTVRKVVFIKMSCIRGVKMQVRVWYWRQRTTEVDRGKEQEEKKGENFLCYSLLFRITLSQCLLCIVFDYLLYFFFIFFNFFFNFLLLLQRRVH
jgi:hypothetical protein